MRRIAVVGSSGAGKTTMAGALAERLGLDHIELDAINFQPGWTQIDRDEFIRRVDEATDADGWALCGGYDLFDQLRGDKADTIVWLDYPRHVVTRGGRAHVRRADHS